MSRESELLKLKDGKIVAIDRSVGVVMLAYLFKDTDTYVLVNKRSSKMTDFPTRWNLPSGYINWDETGEEGAIRETIEETGIQLPLENVKLVECSTLPSENRQNVVLRYAVEVDESYLHKDIIVDGEEATSAMWMNTKDINKYLWAFKQNETIFRLLNSVKTK